MSCEPFRVFLFVSSEKIRGTVASIYPPLAFRANLEPFHLTLILLDSLRAGMTPSQSCHRCHAAIAFALSDWPSCMFSPLPESDIDAATAMMLLNSAPGHHVDPCKRIYVQHIPHSSSVCHLHTPSCHCFTSYFMLCALLCHMSLTCFSRGCYFKNFKGVFLGQKEP